MSNSEREVIGVTSDPNETLTSGGISAAERERLVIKDEAKQGFMDKVTSIFVKKALPADTGHTLPAETNPNDVPLDNPNDTEMDTRLKAYADNAEAEKAKQAAEDDGVITDGLADVNDEDKHEAA